MDPTNRVQVEEKSTFLHFSESSDLPATGTDGMKSPGHSSSKTRSYSDIPTGTPGRLCPSPLVVTSSPTGSPELVPVDQAAQLGLLGEFSLPDAEEDDDAEFEMNTEEGGGLGSHLCAPGALDIPASITAAGSTDAPKYVPMTPSPAFHPAGMPPEAWTMPALGYAELPPSPAAAYGAGCWETPNQQQPGIMGMIGGCFTSEGGGANKITLPVWGNSPSSGSWEGWEQGTPAGWEAGTWQGNDGRGHCGECVAAGSGKGGFDEKCEGPVAGLFSGVVPPAGSAEEAGLRFLKAQQAAKGASSSGKSSVASWLGGGAETKTGNVISVGGRNISWQTSQQHWGSKTKDGPKGKGRGVGTGASGQQEKGSDGRKPVYTNRRPDSEAESFTTAMIRNLPNKYTRDMLVERLNHAPGLKGSFDFLYLPIDFKNACNVGYAFVNFRSKEHCASFVERFNGVDTQKCLPGFNSRKVCAVTPARVQGLDENVRRLRNSPVMSQLEDHPGWLPLLFDKNGEPEMFPLPNPRSGVLPCPSTG